MSSPDPVAQAAAYQQSLLEALGDDDPAEAQADTASVARALVAEAGGDLRTVPEAGEWSVIECIGHILDAEIIMASRYRWVLAHDEPEIMPYDQAAWVSALHYREADPEALIATFEALRAANLDLWRRSSTAERARVGLHRERGAESFEFMFRMIGGHDRVHLDQARRALGAVRATA
jgi:DinB family protein